jgi:hypothetical protein
MLLLFAGIVSDGKHVNVSSRSNLNSVKNISSTRNLNSVPALKCSYTMQEYQRYNEAENAGISALQ